MKRLIGRISIFESWLTIIRSAIGLGASISVFYMLTSAHVKPGEPYYLNDLAPSNIEEIEQIAIFSGALIVGFVVKEVTKLRLFIASRPSR